jgi:hypothetical protein
MNDPSPEVIEQLRALVSQEFEGFKTAVAQRIVPAISWMNVSSHTQEPALLEVKLTMVRPNIRFPGRADGLDLKFLITRGQPDLPVEISFVTGEGDVLSTAPPVALADVIQNGQSVAPAYQEQLRTYLAAQVDPTSRFLLDTPVGDATTVKRRAEGL